MFIAKLEEKVKESVVYFKLVLMVIQQEEAFQIFSYFEDFKNI